jgi:tissue inhibitor of metalloproteinase
MLKGHVSRLILLAAILLPPRVTACMCLPSASKPCQVNMNAEIVFRGRVTGLQQSTSGSSGSEALRQAHLVVLEAFRGMTDREADIFTSLSDCGIRFEERKEYLIYAWRDKVSGRLETGACSQTALAERSIENIQNLRELTSGKGPSHVFGFTTSEPSDLQLPFRASLPLVGVPILLRSGNKSWQAVTDNRGNYEFKSLAGGLYEISAELSGISTEQRVRQFKLEPGACIRQNFLGVLVGRISGQLLDSLNQPVPNILVDIKAVPPTKQPQIFLRGLTDTQGRFSYGTLEMGQYVLGVNLEDPPGKHDWYGKRVPYSSSYYPGVATASDARIVKLEAGPNQNIDGLEFRLPPNPAPMVVRGNAMLPNGSPARAIVSLLDLAYPGDKAQVDTVRTNPDGSFSISGVEGRPYAILAQARRDGRIQHSELTAIVPNTARPFRLVLSNDDSPESCEVCKRFQIWESPLW